MSISKEQKQEIIESFANMSSKGDFLSLLNYAKTLIYEKAVPFDLRQLNYYINRQPENQKYHTFSIKKKMGGERMIHAPSKGLRVLQSSLNLILQQLYECPAEVTGFVTGKSVVDNAKVHIGKTYVYNIDLQDFFSSIDVARFWGRLKLAPYNLHNSENRKEIANMICAIAGHRMLVERQDKSGKTLKIEKSVLPQGSPCSPVISNIICEKLDRRLKGVSGRFGVIYTRYADDITFSSNHSVFAKSGEFLKEVYRIIQDQNFQIKDEKTRLQSLNTRQIVTGLVVNKKTNVSRKYVDQVRMWIHYCEKKGLVKASAKIQEYYRAEKDTNKSSKADIQNIIAGKLEFLKMVRGADNPTYKNLHVRLMALLHTKASLTGEIQASDQQATQKSSSATLPSLLLQPDHQIPFFMTVHSPRSLVQFLKNFSSNGTALKYTTHSWDAGRDAAMFKDLKDFLGKAHDQYNVFSYPLNQLSKNLNAKIYSFIFREDVSQAGWGTHRIPFGWSSPELMTSTMNDPKLNPEDVILPSPYQKNISGKTIQKFKHVIDIFKNEIEIRDENSALLNLILEKHDRFLPAFATPHIENLESKTFYTDVQWLGKALDLIFENISNRPQFTNVSYVLKDDLPDRYVLEITHIGSSNIGKKCTDEKFCLGKGSFGDIKNYLMNLCDWSIESGFAEGNVRINYLVSDQSTQQYQLIGDIPGFRHRLTFYK